MRQLQVGILDKGACWVTLVIGVAIVAGCQRNTANLGRPPMTVTSVDSVRSRGADLHSQRQRLSEVATTAARSTRALAAPTLTHASTAPAPSAPPSPCEVPPAPAPELRERTELRLRGGLYSPMPGGYMAGYAVDTGLDIAGFRLPVYAIAAGHLDYSEPGHTRWAGADDKAIRLALDEPISLGDRNITHVWYAHLHELVFFQEQDRRHRSAKQQRECRIHVEAGERLGTSGIANGSPHLHLGFLLDNLVWQRAGTFLREDAIREVLGGYRTKERLPTWP